MPRHVGLNHREFYAFFVTPFNPLQVVAGQCDRRQTLLLPLSASNGSFVVSLLLSYVDIQGLARCSGVDRELNNSCQKDELWVQLLKNLDIEFALGGRSQARSKFAPNIYKCDPFDPEDPMPSDVTENDGSPVFPGPAGGRRYYTEPTRYGQDFYIEDGIDYEYERDATTWCKLDPTTGVLTDFVTQLGAYQLSGGKVRGLPLRCDPCGVICDSYATFTAHCCLYAHKQQLVPKEDRVPKQFIDPRRNVGYHVLSPKLRVKAVWKYRQDMFAFFRAPMGKAGEKSMKEIQKWALENVEMNEPVDEASVACCTVERVTRAIVEDTVIAGPYGGFLDAGLYGHYVQQVWKKGWDDFDTGDSHMPKSVMYCITGTDWGGMELDSWRLEREQDPRSNVYMNPRRAELNQQEEERRAQHRGFHERHLNSLKAIEDAKRAEEEEAAAGCCQGL